MSKFILVSFLLLSSQAFAQSQAAPQNACEKRQELIDTIKSDRKDLRNLKDDLKTLLGATKPDSVAQTAIRGLIEDQNAKISLETSDANILKLDCAKLSAPKTAQKEPKPCLDLRATDESIQRLENKEDHLEEDLRQSKKANEDKVKQSAIEAKINAIEGSMISPRSSRTFLVMGCDASQGIVRFTGSQCPADRDAVGGDGTSDNYEGVLCQKRESPKVAVSSILVVPKPVQIIDAYHAEFQPTQSSESYESSSAVDSSTQPK